MKIYTKTKIFLSLSNNSRKFFTEKNSDILYVKPKYYANINSTIPPEIYSEKYKLTFGSQDDYELLEKIGSGRYSNVFKAYDVVNSDYKH